MSGEGKPKRESSQVYLGVPCLSSIQSQKMIAFGHLLNSNPTLSAADMTKTDLATPAQTSGGNG